MTINLADNDPRVSYAVAAGATQSSFTVSFEFFVDADLNVYVDGVLKTLTTDYTVTGGDGSTGSVAMSVIGASGGSTVVITRDIDIERATDFPSAGPFDIISLNEELDKLIAISADLKDASDRALQLTDYDTQVSLTLPDVNTRKGKLLAFNATTGAVEAGSSVAGATSVAALSTDIELLADIEDGTVATNAISNTAAIATDVSTVAGIYSNVTTVAGISTEVTAVVADATDIGTVATNIGYVNTVATNIADVVTVANDLNEAISEIETAANDLNEATSEIDTVATNIANVNTVGLIDSDVTTVAGIAPHVTTVAGIAPNVTTVANNLTDINSFANTYFISATAPSSPTEGDLWFDTANDIMKVYDGAGFVNAGSSVNGTANRVVYTATAGQTTFSATYDAGFVDVYLNGVKLINGTDFTATSGSNIVLASGAALNDTVDIVAYGTFQVGVINIVNDATPQLGGNLDLNNFNITGTGNIPAANLTGNIPAANLTGTLPAIDGSNLTGIAAGGGATGGGSDEIFYENGQTITTNYTITNGKNAMSAGPITINTGVTVTVGTGENWTVV